MATFAPSKYQQDIFDWALNGTGDAFVDAVAGSGKTTTLVQLAKKLQGNSQIFDMLFLSFNVTIVKELTKRLPPMSQVRTLNSLGHRALMRGFNLKRADVQWNKYGDILYSLIKEMVPVEKLQETLRVCKELVSFAMSNMSDGTDESFNELVDHYGLELPRALSEKDTFNLVRTALALGEAQAKKGIISFDDQVYLTVKNGFPVEQASFIMVDEAQDLSKSKLLLVLMARAEGGRILFVGDPRQSIYGFAGADSRAVPHIIEVTNAVVFPLSTSYRCPVSHVKHAQEIVPQIEAGPNAVEGTIQNVSTDYLLDNVKPGDLVLSRVTAPLISVCIKMIKRRIPATVKGRDIGKQLITLTKEALGSRDWSELDPSLDEYQESMTLVLMKRKNPEGALTLLQDKIDGVRACVEGFRSTNLREFTASVESIFKDEGALVELCTIHRAKGLESDNVYIVAPEKLPLVWKNQRDWEKEQESNLDYVARTRSKNTLSYVTT